MIDHIPIGYSENIGCDLVIKCDKGNVYLRDYETNQYTYVCESLKDIFEEYIRQIEEYIKSKKID